jgi:hypothetical protein
MSWCQFTRSCFYFHMHDCYCILLYEFDFICFDAIHVASAYFGVELVVFLVILSTLFVMWIIRTPSSALGRAWTILLIEDWFKIIDII